MEKEELNMRMLVALTGGNPYDEIFKQSKDNQKKEKEGNYTNNGSRHLRKKEEKAY